MKNENIFFATVTFGKSQLQNIEGSMLLNELQTTRFSINCLMISLGCEMNLIRKKRLAIRSQN